MAYFDFRVMSMTYLDIRVMSMTSRKKLNGIWNALSAVKFKPAIYA